MAKRSITQKDIKAAEKILATIKPEPTHEELLAEANEQSLFYFNHIEKDAIKKMVSLRSEFANEENSLSRLISWKSDDILKVEVQLEMVRCFKLLQQDDRDGDAYTPWEAAKYVYLDITERLLEMSSYGGQDISSNSTSSSHNSMAHYRHEALRSAYRWDINFVKYHAKKLGDNFISNEKVR